ncbi:MAG: Ycf66 family protein [Nostoc sp. DedQUE01]
MLTLAQVNFGVRPTGLIEIKLIGTLYLVLAIIYITLMILWLTQRKNTLTLPILIIYIIQGVLAPICMFICGIILIIQGWHLDPLIQFEQLVLLVLIIYLSFKDAIFNMIVRNL